LRPMTDTPHDSSTDTASATRAGFVALIGPPNAGKSTLLNTLVGTKLSIVSRKVQTTRTRLLGLRIHNRTQIGFVDTPGLFAPNKRLERAMIDAAWTGATDADVTALLVDAARKDAAEELAPILQRLADFAQPKVLLLNKVDRIGDKAQLLPLTDQLTRHLSFDAVFMMSALNAQGVEPFLDHVAARLPEGPWLYPEDELSDTPMRLLAAEITREQIFTRLHQELPYACTVETERWDERKDGSVMIEQVIFVQKEGQRAIVLGKGGQQIRDIGTRAREELTEMMERPVHLKLFVKVRPNWQDDSDRYVPWGLNPNA